MNNSGNGLFRGIRVFFGIFMVLVYFGMAYLMVINFFGWRQAPFTWLRWFFALVFGLYGIYRCYRQVKGIDYYRLNNDRKSEKSDNRIDELIKEEHKDE